MSRPTGGAEGRPRGAIDRRLLARVGAARPAIAASVAIGLVATASLAAQAVLLAALLASVFPGGPTHPARAWLLAGFAGAALVRAGCSFAAEFVSRIGASRVKAELRDALVQRCLSSGPGQRTGAVGPAIAGAGELATLAGRGLDSLDVYIGRCVPDMVLAIAAPLALVTAVGVEDWLSALVVIATLGLFPVFGMLVGRTTGELARCRWAEIAALGAHLVDLFEGLPVLKAFGRSRDERARVAEMGEQLRRSSLATLRLAFLSSLVLDTLASVSTALVAVPIGIRLVSGSMRLAPGLAVLLLTPEVFVPLRRASAEFHESAVGLAAAAEALDVLEEGAAPPGAPSCEPTEQPRPMPRASTGVATASLRNVTVRRRDRSTPVFEGLDLDVFPGETVVLVGPNGAGKSTIAALLLGLAAPAHGHVLVGPEDLAASDLAASDLAASDLAAWRRRCAYLSEQPALLAASFEENVRLGAPNAAPARVGAILDELGMAQLVEALPDGLDTRIGEGGWALSAGERQRVGLARALLRDAALYVLDEPTAHLDEEGEEGVVDALARHLAGKSALLVTHRPAVLSLADRVVALRDGVLTTFHGGPEAVRAHRPASAMASGRAPLGLGSALEAGVPA